MFALRVAELCPCGSSEFGSGKPVPAPETPGFSATAGANMCQPGREVCQLRAARQSEPTPAQPPPDAQDDRVQQRPDLAGEAALAGARLLSPGAAPRGYHHREPWSPGWGEHHRYG